MLRPAPVVGGAELAAGIMVPDYTVLPARGVYRPIWRYPPSTLALDPSCHLVHGLGVAGSYAIPDHRRDGVPRSDTST